MDIKVYQVEDLYGFVDKIELVIKCSSLNHCSDEDP
jgi:hypothetical protein